MIKAIAVGLSVALSIGTVLAQPTGAPPKGAPRSSPASAGSGSGSATPAAPTNPEKANTNEALQGGDRPWATGVSADRQQVALRLFREGNVNHNDGLFGKATELYREALKSWDHPAIHYNLALSLMNLDHPIEVEQSLTKAVRFGPAPLEKDKFEHAKEYLLLVEKQLANIEVSCDKPDAKVSVDGKEVFTVKAGEPNIYKARVKIGKHTFVAEKPGYNAQVDAPFIGPGENFRIDSSSTRPRS